MSEIFLSTMKKFDLLPLLHCTVSDNASNNTRFAQCLADNLDPSTHHYNSLGTHISCLAHVAALVVKAMLHCLSEHDEINIIEKLHKLAVTIRLSPQRREKYYNDFILKDEDDIIKLPKVRAPTRWDGDYLILERAVAIKQTLVNIWKQREYSEFQLDATEWRMVDSLIRLLEPFRFVTLQVQEASNNISTTYPHYEYMFSHLEHESKNKGVIGKLCKLGRDKLKEYYGRSDVQSHKYYCSTVLNPSYNARFFKTFDNGKYYQAAMDAFEKEYNHYQTTDPRREIRNPTESHDVNQKKPTQLWSAVMKKAKPTAVNELAIYQKEESREIDDILLWWRDHETTYPVLARMAKDFLSIPGASTFLEESFSAGQDTKNRGSMKEDLINATFTTGSITTLRRNIDSK
ncbi:hypothetical protein SAMD00019534_062980 [Acytostelium subglobosum LB1]|uniref:hypothetical protein n=1 Tax=Acytostelium subglobosum LB1 TaxID=1410327 RepID=UPI00064517E9|nr:hypothetical protein SAMD00019534_062980 [Acytostelium subglobosum LB1]GAM23123.1 hypothetical protein SAMD00019534_062980 [Acytostelium subglobosum LB1]|eukprot:XP_012754350.1 hypothetical protein SAMD00019534_062980 [Acytostelium subglobosum LB1]